MTRIAVDGIDCAGKSTFDGVRERYERRYFPGQRVYLAEVDPRGRADIVVAT